MTTGSITTHRQVAVDQGYFWQPLHTCPLGSKVQLLTDAGVAVYGTYACGREGYIAWAPLPNKPEWLKSDAPPEPFVQVEPEELAKADRAHSRFMVALAIAWAVFCVFAAAVLR